jgi:hypothetical protein
VLGVFLVGVFLKWVSEPPALIGMLASCLAMIYIRFATNLAWTWYVFVGSAITLIVSALASVAFTPAPESRQDELAPSGAEE